MSLPDEYGDLVVNSDEEADLDFDDDTEDVDKYDERLYYPILIGEVLHQRYRIEHKLGHGGFSTVWMARDMQTNRDVALKITVPGSLGEYEYSMQNEIIRAVQDTSNLLIYLDTFLLPGPSSSYIHRVLVFPVRGPSLSSYSLSPGTLSISTRMIAARQLLKALQSLHSGGIVHRG